MSRRNRLDMDVLFPLGILAAEQAGLRQTFLLPILKYSGVFNTEED